jgi:hypothetical protein
MKMGPGVRRIRVTGPRFRTRLRGGAIDTGPFSVVILMPGMTKGRSFEG